MQKEGKNSCEKEENKKQGKVGDSRNEVSHFSKQHKKANGKRRRGVIKVRDGGRRAVLTWGFVLFFSSVYPRLSSEGSGPRGIKVSQIT